MTERDFRGFYDRNVIRRGGFEYFARVLARHNDVVAGDALMDALAAVWIKFRNDPLDEATESHMRGYTFRCIRNYILNWYRDSRTRGKLFDAGLTDAAFDVAASAAAATPEQVVEIIDGILSKLPPELEAAVRLCCLTNPPVSHPEAAEILGISVATLYRHIEKAKRILASGKLPDIGLEVIGM
jgi:RNA polymerase sigma factor (sigma-70 family)